MTSHGTDPLRIFHSDPEAVDASAQGVMSSSRRTRRVLAFLGVVVLLASAVTYWAWFQTVERRAIGDLPAHERKALYERTLRTLETSCAPTKSPQGLDSFCREQAEFILQFPECDKSCSVLADQHLNTPSR